MANRSNIGVCECVCWWVECISICFISSISIILFSHSIHAYKGSMSSSSSTKPMACVCIDGRLVIVLSRMCVIFVINATEMLVDNMRKEDPILDVWTIDLLHCVWYATYESTAKRCRSFQLKLRFFAALRWNANVFFGLLTQTHRNYSWKRTWQLRICSFQNYA